MCNCYTVTCWTQRRVATVFRPLPPTLPATSAPALACCERYRTSPPTQLTTSGYFTKTKTVKFGDIMRLNRN